MVFVFFGKEKESRLKLHNISGELEDAHCPKCGSLDLRYAHMLIECNKCGIGMLRKEFDMWKDDWKKLGSIKQRTK